MDGLEVHGCPGLESDDGVQQQKEACEAGREFLRHILALDEDSVCEDWCRLEVVRYDAASKRVVLHVHRLPRGDNARPQWVALEGIRVGVVVPDCHRDCPHAAVLSAAYEREPPAGSPAALCKAGVLPRPKLQRMAFGVLSRCANVGCRSAEHLQYVCEACTAAIVQLRAGPEGQAILRAAAPVAVTAAAVPAAAAAAAAAAAVAGAGAGADADAAAAAADADADVSVATDADADANAAVADNAAAAGVELPVPAPP